MTGEGPKKAGKEQWAGKRRPMTRKSGFTARHSVEIDVLQIDGVILDRGHEMIITYHLPDARCGDTIGFGGWYCADNELEVVIVGTPERSVLSRYSWPNWNKIGSQWISNTTQPKSIDIHLKAKQATKIAMYGLQCGIIKHEYLEIYNNRPTLLRNMWSFAPEGNFYIDSANGTVSVEADMELFRIQNVATLYLKSCNRCGRFLPINRADQRAHLSFTNHCVADHCRPCKHSSFGRIYGKDKPEDPYKFEYGFQLECRFCKKFEVNAPHNPQRTSAQMKEDAQRRRSIELLLEHLYEGSSQLRYRHETGLELANDVFERFERRCFKCRTTLTAPSDMQLDHTRPLALLWPLDQSATALCATCNSTKRDRPPAEFYSEGELKGLSEITGISITKLKDSSPNLEAFQRLYQRANWFFHTFLILPELQEVKEGKTASELLLKALDKALQRTPGGPPYTMEELRLKASNYKTQ